MLALEVQRVCRIPITADSQHFIRAFINRNDVRLRQWIIFILLIVDAVQHHVHMYFINGVSIVLSQRITAFFGLFLLNIRVEKDWLTQIYVTIEA